LRLQLFDEGAVLRLVFRPNRTQGDWFAMPSDVLDEFDRVGRDCEVCGAGSLLAADAQSRVECNDTFVIGPQWIDVELGEFGQIGQHLRQ